MTSKLKTINSKPVHAKIDQLVSEQDQANQSIRSLEQHFRKLRAFVPVTGLMTQSIAV